jgi:hypothetical protein
VACTLAPVEGLSQPEAQKGYLRPHGHQVRPPAATAQDVMGALKATRDTRYPALPSGWRPAERRSCGALATRSWSLDNRCDVDPRVGDGSPDQVPWSRGDRCASADDLQRATLASLGMVFAQISTIAEVTDKIRSSVTSSAMAPGSY